MTENEERESISIRWNQLKAQKQERLAQEKNHSRKARTHRLIENGALAEKYLRCERIEPKEFEKVLQALVSILEVKVFLYAGETGDESGLNLIISKNQGR